MSLTPPYRIFQYPWQRRVLLFSRSVDWFQLLVSSITPPSRVTLKPSGGMAGEEGFVVVDQPETALPQNHLLLLVAPTVVNVNMMTNRSLWHIEHPVMVTKLFMLLRLLLILWFLSIARLAIVALETVAMWFLFVSRLLLLLCLVTSFLLFSTPWHFSASIVSMRMKAGLNDQTE